MALDGKTVLTRARPPAGTALPWRRLHQTQTNPAPEGLRERRGETSGPVPQATQHFSKHGGNSYYWEMSQLIGRWGMARLGSRGHLKGMGGLMMRISRIRGYGGRELLDRARNQD